MKVRFQENSIRFRLSEKNLVDLSNEKTVESSTVFSPFDRISFRIELWHLATPKAFFQDHMLKINISEEEFLTWKNSDAEGIYFEEIISNDLQLHVALEKDFPCKH